MVPVCLAASPCPALQVRVEERKRLVVLQWVHVPSRRQFELPLSSPRIWTNSYKADHWVKLHKEVKDSPGMLQQQWRQHSDSPTTQVVCARWVLTLFSSNSVFCVSGRLSASVVVTKVYPAVQYTAIQSCRSPADCCVLLAAAVPTTCLMQGAWRPLPIARDYIYTPVAVRPAPPPPKEAPMHYSSSRKRKRRRDAVSSKDAAAAVGAGTKRQRQRGQQQQQQVEGEQAIDKRVTASSSKGSKSETPGKQQQQQRVCATRGSNSICSAGSAGGSAGSQKQQQRQRKLTGMARVEAIVAGAGGAVASAGAGSVAKVSSSRASTPAAPVRENGSITDAPENAAGIATASRQAGSAAAAGAGGRESSSAGKRCSSSSTPGRAGVLQAQLLVAAKQRPAGCTLHTAVGCS
jgi:hypothetical protein